MKGRTSHILGFVMIVGVVLAACGPAATPEAAPTEAPEGAPAATSPPAVEPTVALPPTEAPEEPFVLRIGMEGDLFDCLNFAACAHGYFAWEVLYDHLWDFREVGGRVQPELAESWEVSDDLMNWTIHLADLEGATFHDGTPLDAEAIAWSLNYWASNDAISWFLGTEVGEGFGFEVIDDRTLSLQMLEPLTPEAFESAMGYVAIVPQHIWENYDSETIWDFDNAEAIGSGSYKLMEFEPGQHTILDAHAGSFRGVPPVDRIVVQNYSSQDTLAQALIVGEIDAVFGLPPTLLGALENIPELTIHQRSGVWNNPFMLFNLWEGGVRHPAIGDKAVRQAIAHAIDKQQIVDVVYGGHAIASDNWFDNGLLYQKWQDPDLMAYEFDLDLAAAMLEEAGYVDSDADGVREMNDGSGEPLSFRFYYDVSQADHLATAEMISAWLSLIGIDAQVEGLEGSTLTDTLLMGDYDMAMVIWGFDPDPDIMLLTLHTVGVDWEINWSGYSNPEYDALYWDQHYATDYEERRDVIWQMLEIVQEDLPLMQLDVVESFDVFRNDRIRFPVTDTYWSPWLTGVIYNFERVE